MAKEWTLKELADDTGVPERTIRFYIAKQLLPPPIKGGKGALYGLVHKQLLKKIKELQSQGMMLSKIAHFIAARESDIDFEMYSEPDHYDDLIVSNELPPGQRRMAKKHYSAIQKNLSEPETWHKYHIDDDVIVMIRAGTSPWRIKKILKILQLISYDNDEK